jgi:hypothetical protein
VTKIVVEYLAVISATGEDQNSSDSKDSNRQLRQLQPAASADERLEHADDCAVSSVVERNHSRRQVARSSTADYGLSKRMIEAVQVSLARTPREFVETERDLARKRARFQVEE